MRLFEASHVPEILREAGPDGLHVEKIAERNGVDASKLGESRSHHVFLYIGALNLDVNLYTRDLNPTSLLCPLIPLLLL